MNIRRWMQAASVAPVLMAVVAVSGSSGAPALPRPKFGPWTSASSQES
jgi:hypothetical protein